MTTSLRRISAILVLAAAVTLLVADVGAAKLPWKNGRYIGSSSQPQHNTLQFDVKKKQILFVYFDFYLPGCTYPCIQPSWVGSSAKIKKKGKKGEFEAPGPVDGYYGYISGTLKGKKAHGSVYYAPGGYDADSPPLPYSWEAERAGK